jgi:hypothetical protein
MDTPSKPAKPSHKRVGGCLALVLLGLTATFGCVTTDTITAPLKVEKNSVPVTQLLAYWPNQVFYGPDPTNGGKQIPALGGRVYLMGADLTYPLQGDGKIVVQLFARQGDNPQAAPVLKAQWTFDEVTLKTKCLRKDFLGWGYTLFLPWDTYQSDLSKVQLKVCYHPAKGMPVYSESLITLNSGPEATPVVRNRQVLGDPGKARAANTPNNFLQPLSAAEKSPSKPVFQPIQGNGGRS